MIDALPTAMAVRKVLHERELSMYALAKVLDVSAIMISRYKAGEACMGLHTAAVFEYEFQINITDARRPGRQANENS